MGGSVITFLIAADPPPRLDRALSRDAPAQASLSRTRLARLIDAGLVQIDGKVIRTPRTRVAEGACVVITLPEAEPSEVLPEAIALEILYEDQELAVINKPAGMVVHPAPGATSGTLVHALLHHFGDALSGVGGVRRPGIVHRIDKDTSGLLVVAKSDRAHHGLSAQFAAHSAERRYDAIVHGVPDQGAPRLRGVHGVSFEPGGILRIATRLDRHRHDRQRQAVTMSGGRSAVTRARVIERFGIPACAALLACWLETGRTHQIRVHMAHAGHGLLGDPVYGGRRKFSQRALPPGAAALAESFTRQALHAAVLGFAHPVSGQPMRFEVEMPADMQRLLDALRGADARS